AHWCHRTELLRQLFRLRGRRGLELAREPGGQLLVRSQCAAPVTRGREQPHETARARLVSRIESHRLTNGLRFGRAGSLQRVGLLPCRRPYRAAERCAFFFQPLLEFGRSGYVKTGREV